MNSLGDGFCAEAPDRQTADSKTVNSQQARAISNQRVSSQPEENDNQPVAGPAIARQSWRSSAGIFTPAR